MASKAYRNRTLLFAFVLLMLFVATSSGNSIAGILEVKIIVKPLDYPLPGVRVDLLSDRLDLISSLYTNERGIVVFNDIDKNMKYTLVTESIGFRPEKVDYKLIDREAQDTVTIRIDRYISVSMIRLVAKSEVYDGKPIRVYGYLHCSSNGAALYFHKEDYDNSITINSLMVVGGGSTQLEKYSEEYVFIEGDFKSNEEGYDCEHSGVIENITRVR